MQFDIMGEVRDFPSTERYLYRPRPANCRDCGTVFTKNGPTAVRCEPCRAKRKVRIDHQANERLKARRKAKREAKP